MERKKLGVLGGMGPQATLEFYQRVLDRTAAERDQDHIETLLLSDTRMPDRTAAILSGDAEEVRARLLRDAKLLESWGAGCIAIPCNTSHAFLPRFQGELSVPVVNMVEETAEKLRALGVRRAGILATDGTLRMGLYQTACARRGVEAVSPPPQVQELVMSVIYDDVKAGRPGDGAKCAAIDAWLARAGCGAGVLACTELSVCRAWGDLPGRYVDALDVLAERCVVLCGHPLRPSKAREER